MEARAQPDGQLGEDVVVELVPTGLKGPLLTLFPTSGAVLFATTAGGLMRSDDGAVTWRPESLPPLPADRTIWGVALDRAGRTVAFSGRSRAFAGADAWTALELPPSATRWEVSPADPEVLFAAAVPFAISGGTISACCAGEFRFWRSLDAGASWDLMFSRGRAGTCAFEIRPHPTDARRVFTRWQGCYSSAGSAARIEQSLDQGATWSTFRESSSPIDHFEIPLGKSPGEFLVSSRVCRLCTTDSPTTTYLERIDDDGGTLASLLVFEGSRSRGDSTDPLNDAPGIARLGRPVWDPLTGAMLVGQTRASPDGGTTWGLVPELGATELVMSGSGLYAVTSSGLFRVKVQRVNAPLKEASQVVTSDLQRPRGVAVSIDGSVLVTDAHGVKSFSPEGQVVGESSPLIAPSGVVADAQGQVYVAALSKPGKVQSFTVDGKSVLVWKSSKGLPARGVAVHPDGSLFVTTGSAVWHISTTGEDLGHLDEHD